MNRSIVLAAALVVALPATRTLADEMRFGLPIACTLGEDCFVMNYVDSAPGPEVEDFTCGPISYDGHDGTDFAVNTFAAMRAGVAVLAAAPGRVLALRDGMPDLGLDGTPPELLDGQECGNGVLVDHGDGWETQYCHLRDGSVTVREGDRVAAGDTLGLVGYSGFTEYPHVEFTLRKDGVEIDPFDTDGARRCGADDGPGDDLWTDPPGYQPGGVVTAGLFDAVPEYGAVKDGTAHVDALAGDAPALVGWVLIHGARAGDAVEITVTDPQGRVFHRHEERLEKTQAMAMRAAGRKRPDGGWTPGEWRVETRLARGGVVIDTGAAVSLVGR